MAVPGDEAIWLWIGTAGMALGTLAFLAMGWNETDERKKTYYIVTTFIPAIAAVSYFSMASGFGVIEIPNHDYPIYWARYADWLFTTPLLLLDLALLAGASRNTIGTLVGLDIAMIVTGLGGALATEGAAYRLAWWGISCGFFLVLLYFLVGRLTAGAQEQPGEVGSLFGTLRNLTLVLWFAYPVVWLVGTEGLAIIGLYPETAIFMVLDLSAKVGFGYLLLRSHAVLDSAETEAGTGQQPEAA